MIEIKTPCALLPEDDENYHRIMGADGRIVIEAQGLAALGGQFVDAINTLAAIEKHEMAVIPKLSGGWSVEFGDAPGIGSPSDDSNVYEATGATLTEAVAKAVAQIEGKS